MSLSEEKVLILKMLEEGKINSEEAARLIEALEAGARQSSEGNYSRQQKQQANFQDEINKMRDRVNEWRKDFKNNYNQKDFDRMVDDFSNKAEKVGKNLATTTFGIMDKMVDFVGSFVDTSAFNFFGAYKLEEREFEAEAVEGMDLLIEGVNGHIQVKKHLDNKIVIKTKVRSPQNNVDSILVFNKNENSIVLKLNKIGNVSVSHEVYLPVLKFNNIRFETTNAKIYVEDALSNSFESITKNAHIELMGVNSERINISTKNAKIQVGYVICKDIDINTNNSLIDIKHIKAENINAFTKNGRILVENVQVNNNASGMKMQLRTTNGGIKVNMNDLENKGYKVKAHTTNGGVNLLVPDMQYSDLNRQSGGTSFVDAESKGFDGYTQKVFIDAETVNGYIEIVK